MSVTPERCNAELLRGEKILVATGSYPYRPKELFPFTNPHVYDSDTILSLYEIPQSLVVVGGGVIGCEYACMFAALGVRVTVIERRGSLLGGIDAEISESLREQMVDAGIEVIFQDEVEGVRNLGGGVMEVPLKSGRLLADVHAILVSSGRSGQTAGLGLEKLGIELTRRGHVLVDPHTFQTKLPHVYAAGDVIGNPALASTAMAQARMAVAHAFELPFNTGLVEVLPAGIYTIPECSSVGVTEETLCEQKVAYVVGKADYADNARGQIIGDSKGFLKLLFRADDMELLAPRHRRAGHRDHPHRPDGTADPSQSGSVHPILATITLRYRSFTSTPPTMLWAIGSGSGRAAMARRQRRSRPPRRSRRNERLVPTQSASHSSERCPLSMALPSWKPRSIACKIRSPRRRTLAPGSPSCLRPKKSPKRAIHQGQRTPQTRRRSAWRGRVGPRCGRRRTGEVRSGGSLRDKDCPGGVRDEAKGAGAVGGIEFLGHDVGGVQEAGGGVGSSAVARGRGNAVARVVEGGPHDACGTLIETFVPQVERVEVVCGSHPADRGAGPPQATSCTKFRRRRSRSAWERGRRRTP